MKKNHFLAFAALCMGVFMPGSAMADDTTTVDVHQLVVELKAGGNYTFNLDTAPKVSFEQENLVVTVGEDRMEMALSDVKDYHFAIKKVDTGIEKTGKEDVYDTSAHFRITQTDIQGLAPGETVTVYTMDGKLVARAKADANGTAQIAMQQLSQGVFILKTSSKSIKLINR